MAAARQTPALLKLWGENRCVWSNGACELHHASIRKGGYSSRHYHEQKPNLFYIVAGKLLVHTYASSIATIPSTTVELGRGDQVTVEPGAWHRFEALTDVELVEVYWACLAPGQDIVRADEGGCKEQP